MDLSENLNFIDFIKKAQNNKRSYILSLSLSVCSLFALIHNDESSIYYA